MKVLEKVLLATDFSKSSNYVVDKAIIFAKAFQSEITLVYVLPDDISNKKAKNLLTEAALLKLKKMETYVNEQGVETSPSILEFGSYHGKIIEAANQIEANLIFMGAGDKPKDEPFQLGMTAENVVRNSEKPVWVEKQGGVMETQNILCPIDFSEESGRALKNAIVFARRYDAKLTIFHAFEKQFSGDVSLNVDWTSYNEQAFLEHSNQMIEFLKGFNLTNLNWEKEIQSGRPHVQILAAVKKHKSDLIFMGASGRTGLSKLILGSVTERVIREVPCSFVVIKSEDAIELKFENRVNDLETHYKQAVQLLNDGFLKEAIMEFKKCLNVHDMHIPSLSGLAKVYKLLNNEEESKRYHHKAREVYNRIWDLKIEDEIRRTYKM